jgi:hypothetical protein
LLLLLLLLAAFGERGDGLAAVVGGVAGADAEEDVVLADGQGELVGVAG